MSDEREDHDLENETPEDDVDAESGADGDQDRVEEKSYLKKNAHPAEGPKALWLISYADFMTVLMIFFLAMYGYSYLAKDTVMKARQVANYQEFMEVVQKMQERLGDQLKVEESIDKVTLKVGEKVLFPSGSARLSAPAASTLAELANSIKLLEGDVIIEGHTDNIPVVGGPFKSNWELSAARAFSVINALSDNGVEAQRLAAWGFGENRPVTANDTVENRAKNRRIEVIVMRKKAAV